jgi:hypothetical protein
VNNLENISGIKNTDENEKNPILNINTKIKKIYNEPNSDNERIDENEEFAIVTI